MKCPKCPGLIAESQTKAKVAYGTCLFCKGVWIKLDNLPKIFRTEKVSALVTAGFTKKAPTSFKCSYCESPMLTGKVKDTDLTLDECPTCRSLYFDKGEMDTLLKIVAGQDLPVSQGVKFDTAKMYPTKENCRVCKSETLWSYKDKEDRFKTCPKCDGILSTVEVLQKIAKQSLFGPTMFTFRKFSGEVKECRHCHQQQTGNSGSCQKCGRELSRAKCFKCKGEMSEYILHDATIERCQICNDVWLDPNELEKIMTLMPDVRKAYEEGQRKIELNGAIAGAVAKTSEMMIDASNRQFLERSPLGRRLGPLIFFFYPK